MLAQPQRQKYQFPKIQSISQKSTKIVSESSFSRTHANCEILVFVKNVYIAIGDDDDDDDKYFTLHCNLTTLLQMMMIVIVP